MLTSWSGQKSCVERHEVLRTVISKDGSSQTILPLSPDVFPVTIIAEPLSLAQVEAKLEQDMKAPFDISKSVARSTVYTRVEKEGGGAKVVLGLSFHHVAFDGFSEDVLMRDIAAFYNVSSLPSLPATYVDYAAWQRELLDGPDGISKEQASWWRDELGDANTILELSSDRVRSPGLKVGGNFDVTIDASLRQIVDTASQRMGTTNFAVLMSAFGLLMGTYARAKRCPRGDSHERKKAPGDIQHGKHVCRDASHSRAV